MRKSRTLCGLCSESSTEKMAAVYWGWTWPTGDRRSYTQWFDQECFESLQNSLQRCITDDSCRYCDKATDQDPVTRLWFTVYAPHSERYDNYVDYHPACFEKDVDQYYLNARRNLGTRVGGAGPRSPNQGKGWRSWGEQGIEPA